MTTEKYIISAHSYGEAASIARETGIDFKSFVYIQLPIYLHPQEIRKGIYGMSASFEKLFGKFSDAEIKYLAKNYKPSYFNFSVALEKIKEGKKVKRKAWGGYWFLPEFNVIGERIEGRLHSHTVNKTIMARLKDDGGYVPAQPYQEDILAEDWEEA